jgi:hypothetical protein
MPHRVLGVRSELRNRARPIFRNNGYSLKTNGGPLTRFTLRSTLSSSRSAILWKGVLLFIAKSLRPKT